MRTSTKTSVRPSRAIRSISPKRVRKLRPTMVRPCRIRYAAALDSARPPSAPGVGLRGSFGDEFTVAIHGELALARELPSGLKRHAAGCAVEVELRGRTVFERGRDAERIEPERVEPRERRTVENAAGQSRELRR